jgi:hypothetical protein
VLLLAYLIPRAQQREKARGLRHSDRGLIRSHPHLPYKPLGILEEARLSWLTISPNTSTVAAQEREGKGQFHAGDRHAQPTMTTLDDNNMAGNQCGSTNPTQYSPIESRHQSLVDTICPIADVQVYRDQEIYHAAHIQRSTGVVYVSQILHSYATKTFYVYLRWGESQYMLNGPFDTVEQAKSIFTTKYRETFGVSWEERTIVTNSKWPNDKKEVMSLFPSFFLAPIQFTGGKRF